MKSARNNPCLAYGCPLYARAKGYCRLHYQQAYRRALRAVPRNHIPKRAVLTVHHMSAVLNALRAASGQTLSVATLIAAVWPSPDDEPTRPEMAVRFYIHKLRRLGYPIKAWQRLGYRFVYS